MIMSGSKAATIRHIQVVDIHGTRFYDITFTHDDAPDTLRNARIGVESAYNAPQMGDRVQVAYLMNVVVSVARQQ